MRIAFISTMSGSPWGGSEALWTQAALRLKQQGVEVSASVVEWTPLHPRVDCLRREGVLLHTRPMAHPFWRRGLHRFLRPRGALHDLQFGRFLDDRRPQLAVLSDGAVLPPVDLIEQCVARGVPFVTIGQANDEGWWPDDDRSRHYRAGLSGALRCFFVAEANWRLAEKQIGCTLENAEVVRNPFNVAYDAYPPWPSVDEQEELRLACVARLHPPSKGQDILFEALASTEWTARNWKLSLYGEGPNKESLMRLAERLGIAARVKFCGYVADVARIWSDNHVLILPSRSEGLPLALVEAMLCGRPAIVTKIAGNTELVDDGVTGFLAESATVTSMGKALETAWAWRNNLRRIGEEARKRVRELVPPDPAGVFAEKLKAYTDAVIDRRVLR